MDSDGFLFQTSLESQPRSVPRPAPAVMAAQAIVPWTASRLVAAGIAWLMVETPLPLAAPLPNSRRA